MKKENSGWKINEKIILLAGLIIAIFLLVKFSGITYGNNLENITGEFIPNGNSDLEIIPDQIIRPDILPEEIETHPDWICVDEETITSYFTIVEAHYSGEKVNVHNFKGEWVGAYKKDFLQQLRIDGAGKGDGK